MNSNVGMGSLLLAVSSATADMIWPDVQYPHWYPSRARAALPH
jgi:hypothetical protein